MFYSKSINSIGTIRNANRIISKSYINKKASLLEKTSFVENCPPAFIDTGCTYCIPEYPKDKEINIKQDLNNTAISHNRHLIICTGTSSWPSRINDLQNSIAQGLYKVMMKNGRSDNFRALVTNCSLPGSVEKSGVYILPDNIYIPNVEAKDAEDLFHSYMVNDEKADKSRISHLSPIKNKDALILICGHGERDIRCGISAPLLLNEIDKVLSMDTYNESNASANIHIGTCSHIGGHVYAGNLIYIDPNGSAL